MVDYDFPENLYYRFVQVPNMSLRIDIYRRVEKDENALHNLTHAERVGLKFLDESERSLEVIADILRSPHAWGWRADSYK